MPICGRNVVHNMKLIFRLASDPILIQKAAKLYGGIVTGNADFLKTKNACQCIEEFDIVLPDYSWLSDVKKIDFICGA